MPDLPEVKEELRLDGLEEGLEEDAQTQDTLTSEEEKKMENKNILWKKRVTTLTRNSHADPITATI